MSIWCTAFYTYFVWWPFLLSDEYDEVEVPHKTLINSCMLAWMMICMAIVAWYATKYEKGDIQAIRFGTFGLMIWAVPGFFLVQTRTVWAVTDSAIVTLTFIPC